MIQHVRLDHSFEHCAGYVHFPSSAQDSHAIDAILFLHGHGEAERGESPDPVRLLQQPLPAYFCDRLLLTRELGWIPGDEAWDLPSAGVCNAWRQRFELYAPQKRAPGGPWTKSELDEIIKWVLPQKKRWHLAGTSLGGSGVLELLALYSGDAKFLSVSLACPKPFTPLPQINLPIRTYYGERDFYDIRTFCNHHKHELNAIEMPVPFQDLGKAHGYVCRHAYQTGHFVEWLQSLSTSVASSATAQLPTTPPSRSPTGEVPSASLPKATITEEQASLQTEPPKKG